MTFMELACFCNTIQMDVVMDRFRLKVGWMSVIIFWYIDDKSRLFICQNRLVVPTSESYLLWDANPFVM